MERTWKLTAAGIMTIIGGCYGLAFGIALTRGVAILNILFNAVGIGGTPWVGTSQEFVEYGIAYIITGVITLTGGIFALPPEWRYPKTRRIWGFVLAGAVLSLWMFPIGTVLGSISIGFLAKSKWDTYRKHLN